MVKHLDESADESSIDHVGWQLWRAAETWKRAFEEGMVAKGHPWFAEARGGVLRYLGKEGSPQSELASRMRITKQAVQQLVDQLQEDGIVTRVASEDDRRNRRVVLTARGRAALRDANDVKRNVEAVIIRKLGRSDFNQLIALLGRIAE